MTGAVIARRVAETLALHAETIEFARRQARSGHYVTRTERALAELADVVENQQ